MLGFFTILAECQRKYLLIYPVGANKSSVKREVLLYHISPSAIHLDTVDSHCFASNHTNVEWILKQVS